MTDVIVAQGKKLRNMGDGSYAEVIAAAPPPGVFVHGQKTVTTAGTAVALAADATALYRGVLVKALSTNTSLVYVGGEDVDSTNGFELEAGDLAYLEVDDLADVYVDAAENGEGVSFVGS